MKKRLPLLLISSLCMALSGCAQMNEGLASLGKETPKNAPPGYHSFIEAQQYEKNGEFYWAAIDYCNAAELGHPQAKAKCIELSFRAAIKRPIDVCKARRFDKKAYQVCRLLIQDENKAKAEIKAVVNQYNKKKMKARIQSGEFQDFKAEEF